MKLKRKCGRGSVTKVVERLLLLLLVLVFQQLVSITECTRITGSFRSGDFFKFILKFGFQKAETHSQRDSFGYIFGNITSEQEFGLPITMVVLDKTTFLELYNNRSFYDRDRSCQRMFSHLSLIAYDADCNKFAKRDFIRHIPCPKGHLCQDEDTPSNVLPGHQFTYVVNKELEPRFWYLAMVSCYRDPQTCQYRYYDPSKFEHMSRWSHNLNKSTANVDKIYSPQLIYSQTLKYDIHLVNTHPNNSAAHPLTYEFSYDQQNLLEMYLIFLLVYMVLLPMQIYAVRLQKHPVTKLFTISLLSEFVSLALITTHLIKFAINGLGEPDLQAAGDILDIFSRTTFMLILLLLAKGWAVTRQQISRTGWIILMTIWVPYCAFHVFLYIWDRTEVDIVSDIDEYQTWPGWIVLILRTSFMMWFLYELRNTMKYEHSTKKLDFLLHLGASSLVWFIYLPIVAIVALQVSPMWRYKLLLGITNSADCLAYCVMTGLLWPNRAGQYLLLAGIKYSGMDELDEFNEAPHIVRERERRRNSPPDSVMVNGGSSIPNSRAINQQQLSHHSNTKNTFNLGISTSIPHSINGDACADLLDTEDLDAELLTDLNKNSHVVA